MKAIIGVILTLATVAAVAQTYVRPHVRKDGTYVEGHYRSNPDSSRQNNYSTQGNTNPYTGQQGTVNPTPNVQPLNPYQPQQQNSWPYNR